MKDFYIYQFPFEGEICIYLVDGPAIRKNTSMEFIDGGHDLIYNFIPAKEVWVDSSIEISERKYIILHELYERSKMEEGYGYEDAHDLANTFEHNFRVTPENIEEEIIKLMNSSKEITAGIEFRK